MSATATATVNPFFQPTQISGCQLWFDGADSRTFSFSSNSNISQWRDKSSNAYVVNQAITSNQPVFTSNIQNGFSGVQFQTITYLSNATSNMVNFTTGAATSVFVAARNASANSGWNIFNTIWFNAAGGGGTQRYHFSFNQSATPGTTLYANTALVGQVTSNAVSANSNAILGFTVSASLATIHTNGSSNGYAGVSLPDANNSNVFLLGENRNNTLLGSNVAIFEMIGYNTQVTTADRQQIEGYLAWKWGLQTNLPSDHPYKNSPISPLLNPPRSLPTAIGSPWLPTQISGSYVWLDASTSNNFTFGSGSNISTWIDRSGNLYSATAGNNPTWDSVNKRVRFSNASSQYMSNIVAPLNLTQRSFFFVLEEITNTNVCGIMPIIPNPTSGNDYQTTTGLTIEGTTGLYFYGNNGGYANKINTTNPLSKAIYSEVYSNRNGTGYLNGTSNSSATGNYTPGTSSGYGLGGRWANGITTPYFNGYMYEILVYNVALTTTQRQQVEGYLAWKWNLVGNLPANHPYKNYPTFTPSVSLPARSIGISMTWLPTQISGSALWLDAADTSKITTSETTVTAITDKSTSPKTITITNTVSYISGQAFIFTNTNGCLNLTGMPAAPYDIFTVATANSATNIYRTLLRTASSPGTHPFLLEVNTNNLGMWNGTGFQQFGSLTMTANEKALVYASMASNRTMQAAKNGTVALTTATAAGNESIIVALGNLQSAYGGGQPWGTLQEIIIYSTTLTLSQRQQVEGYLAWKWGLVANLPATHPYKFFPPPP